jgi:hypothetical protein
MAEPAKKRQSKAPKKATAAEVVTGEVVKESAITTISETPDLDLVEKATSDIRQILAETVVQSQRRVGEYILANFYNNDVEEYRRHTPKKHASLNALAEKCETMELPVKKTFLHTSINVAIYEHLILKLLVGGEASFPALPPSHQAAIITLRDPELMEEVSKEARSKGMTVRELRVLVNDKREELRSEKATRPGRKPTHVVVKAVDRCLRALQKGGKNLFDAKDVKSLKAADREKVRGMIEKLQGRLQFVLERLGREEPAGN